MQGVPGVGDVEGVGERVAGGGSDGVGALLEVGEGGLEVLEELLVGLCMRGSIAKHRGGAKGGRAGGLRASKGGR